jgi:single-stranded-DNA-specific exonuclease
MTKRWVLKDAADTVTVQELATGLNINSVLSTLLVRRGVNTFDEAKYFLSPKSPAPARSFPDAGYGKSY